MSESWALSRRRGWLKAVSDEQGSLWEEYCFKNGLDCIAIAGKGNAYDFTCRVHPDRPLSELGYLEIEDLLNGWGLRERSLGSWDSVSEFSFQFADFSQTQELVDEVKAVLRRDRTSRRAVELAAHPAPLEGMAVALHRTGLWEEHRLEEAVYVLETSAGSGRVFADGLEHLLVEGEDYYVREIPNMRDHVLVLRSDQLPLVGIHLERFELLSLPDERGADE